MSLFGGSSRKQQEAEQLQMFQARSEMEFTMNMFNAMTRNCYRKCVPSCATARPERRRDDLRRPARVQVHETPKVGKEMEKQNAAMANQAGMAIRGQ